MLGGQDGKLSIAVVNFDLNEQSRRASAAVFGGESVTNSLKSHPLKAGKDRYTAPNM